MGMATGITSKSECEIQDLQQRLVLKDLEIMRLREALLKIEFEYDYTLDKELTEAIVAGFELARATPATYDDLMAWHNEQLGEPVAWIKPDFLGRGYAELDELHEYKFSPMTINHNAIPLYAKKG